MEGEFKPARLVRRPVNLFRTLFNILSAGIPLLGLGAFTATLFGADRLYVEIACALGGFVILGACLYFALSRSAWICSSCRGEIDMDTPPGDSCPHCGRGLKLPRFFMES